MSENGQPVNVLTIYKSIYDNRIGPRNLFVFNFDRYILFRTFFFLLGQNTTRLWFLDTTSIDPLYRPLSTVIRTFVFQYKVSLSVTRTSVSLVLIDESLPYFFDSITNR